jgi:hypothetical protein
MTPDQKGVLAEAAIAWEAAKLGINVLRPFAPARYDLVFDTDRSLLRVQCKWAVRFGDVVIVKCATSRRGPHGHIRRYYTADEIDAIAAYCAELDRCYFLPIAQFEQRRAIQLRLAPSRNNQRAGINWAKDYEFAATLGRSGAVAQLGERQSGTLEVTGSSPVGSIR